MSAANLLSWALLLSTVYQTWAIGKRKRHAWVVGGVAQFGWAYLAYLTEAWGMLALAAIMLALSINNWRNHA